MAITSVLAAVFIPSALQTGSTGVIYRQFALTIALSMGFSALLALSFTPALCASLLRPEHLKGNLVFNASTIFWSQGLSHPPGHMLPWSHWSRPHGPDECVQRITRNLLERAIK